MNAKRSACLGLLGLLMAAGLSACGGTGNSKVDPDEYVKARVPNLIKCLSDERPDVRRQAAYGLGNCRSLGSQAIPALTDAMQDPDVNVCCTATWALGMIGEGAGMRGLHRGRAD